MSKILLISSQVLRHYIRQRGFWFMTIAMPVLLIVIWGASGLLDEEPAWEDDDSPPTPEGHEGYVDQAGLISTIPESLPPDLFTAYPDEEAANAALEAGDIDVYYVVPQDYRDTGNIERVSLKLPPGPVETPLFQWVLITNLFPDKSEMEIGYLRYPGPIQHVTLASDGEPSTVVQSFLPFMLALIVLMPLFTSGGYLFQSLIKEKENRVMEILFLSSKPQQLLTGKLIGLGVLSLIQYAIWIGVSLGAARVSGRELPDILANLNLTMTETLLFIPYAIGAYSLYAGLMAGLGALAPDMENTRLLTFVITLPMLIPFYVMTAIVTAPNGQLATALSLFPFSAPITMLIRMTSTAVPGWQIALSLGLMAVTVIIVIGLMARLFRAQTMLSGEAVSLKRFWSALAG